MRRLALLLAFTALAWAPQAAAQATGEYPHLVLSDGVIEAPGVGELFHNDHTFNALAGTSFTAELTYDSAGTTNDNVIWGLIVATQDTPFAKVFDTGILEPPLLTMPPFILLLPGIPTLSITGVGQMTLFPPPGVFVDPVFVQGIIYDPSHVPALRLTNGLTVDVNVPEFNVNLDFVRNKEGADDGVFGDAPGQPTAGVIDVGPDSLNEFQPIGGVAPPPPVDGANDDVLVSTQTILPVDFRLLPIVPIVDDGPVNPLARPLTTIRGTVSATNPVIPVHDTSFFPSRGHLLIQFGNKHPWAEKTSSGTKAPDAEVVFYDGKTPDSFLNCQRSLIGSTGSENFSHFETQIVAGEFTMASSSAARKRTRVALEASNAHMPHVVIPPFSFDPSIGGEEGGGALVTMDLDLYIYEQVSNGVQGFAVFDRVTGLWRIIPDTDRNPVQGSWNPMIHVAPDRRSFVATLRVPGGVLDWDNKPDELYAIRLDGLNWPASGAEAWEISYQLEGDPATIFVNNVRSRRVIMKASAILGTDPDNFVLFAGLANKWKQSVPTPGSHFVNDQGFESDWIREEVLVRDYIEVPLTPPGSAKAVPSSPRLYMTADFGQIGSGDPVMRFDPEVLPSPDNTALLVAAGYKKNQEDAFVVRNVTVTAGGTVSKVIINATGFQENTLIQAFHLGGHGQGRKGAWAPDGSRFAITLRDGKQNTQRRDWIAVARPTGSDFGFVSAIYEDENSNFQESGALLQDRIILGIRFIDAEHLVFLMGKDDKDDPMGVVGGFEPSMDLMHYDIVTDTMTNLSLTNPAGGEGTSGFENLGKINPAGYFASDNGAFFYYLRAGLTSDVPTSPVPVDTEVLNIVGLNTQTLDLFSVTGTEFSAAALISDMDLPFAEPTPEILAPIETAASMNFIEGSGVQEGMMYFTGHKWSGNGADEVFAFNMTTPFVAFEGTSTSLPGVHVNNLVPNPHSATFAFARTDTADVNVGNQHPFVVDLDNFLYERDLTPAQKFGGAFFGRVMDGSFHFIEPAGNASDALVFTFGLGALPDSGIATFFATPVYYPLGAVSDPLAEPIPVLIPLIDTSLLGSGFSFYLPNAGPSTQVP